MTKRDIGAEILASIEDLKAGNIGRVSVHLGANDVKRIRERVGISQSAFAKVLNISVRTVQDWEQGRREPTGSSRSLLIIADRRPDVLREVFLGSAG